jgi:predicted RNA-binding Zn-ribbon protein involved in translation (DUF1610 family)
MDDIKGIIGQAGRWSLVAVILIIVAEYFNFFNVNRFPIPISWLYIYLLLNGAAAARFKLLDKRASPKLCPKCNTALHVSTAYSCPNCGDLEFGKQGEDRSK